MLIRVKTNLILFFRTLLCTLSVLSYSQDGHYWTQQYGTRSMLLSSSVIGGVDDLGAVYYNPARLSQISNPAFLLSADVYEWNRLKVDDAFGNNKNATNADFGGVPSLAAGTFRIPFLKKHSFAWAILVRQNLDLSMSFKDEVHDDVIEMFPGEEYFGAEISVRSKGKIEWKGFSWSYPVNEKLSVGASGYFSTITNNKYSAINMQALSASNQVAIYRFNKSFSYKHYSLLFKLGLSYESKKTILGLTILTPSIRLRGEGNYQNELFFSGIAGESQNDDLYKTSYQNKLRTEYYSPWGVGAGLTYSVGKSKIHLSSEWFSGIPKYTVMQTANYIGQSVGDTNSFSLVDEGKSVINAGLGIELFLSEKIRFFTSISTDFSTVVPEITNFLTNQPEANNTVFKSNFYHFGGGFVLNIKGADITLGVTQTGATLNLPQPFKFPEDEGDEIFDPNNLVEVDWDRWRIVFSFSLPFLKDIQRKAEEKLGF
jgi:hypothetical protein